MPFVPPPHPAELSDETLLGQCTVERGRGSGPGGQHRNKVETTIRLRHDPTGVASGAGERREQAENLRVAIRRLRIQLALQVRTHRDLAAGTSERWRARVTQPRGDRPPAPPPLPRGRLVIPRTRLRSAAPAGRIACNASHRDYPSLLAEALDVLAQKAWDLRPAAVILDVSPSQLIKFLAKEPSALQRVNTERQQRGEHPLKA